MAVYFKEKEEKKLSLSEYLKKDELKCQYHLCPEKYRAPRTKYIIDAIGDVELDESTYSLFLKQWQCSGGMYDVRTKSETFKGIYDFYKRFPFLTADALDEIWFRYISDLYQEYHLENILEIFLERFGKEDKTFKLFLSFTDEMAKFHHQKYIEDARKIESFEKEYGEEFISRIKTLIIRQHLSLETIIKCLPSAEIIQRDEEQLKSIVESTRMFFGACEPISYQMFESLVTGEGLEYYPEQPQYSICGTKKMDTTFTKKTFLESIKKAKVKKLEIK